MSSWEDIAILENKKLKAELISESEMTKMNEIDILLEEIELGEIELERNRVRNIRESTAMLLELIDKDTIVSYHHPFRTKHEVRGGYKIATGKKARLNETQVFNLFFRFRSRSLNGMASALMCRPSKKNEEWILLLPDDTENRIKEETSVYIEKANVYTVVKGIMNPDHHSFLIENLDRLNIHERCAQSLMHEFGHVLH